MPGDYWNSTQPTDWLVDTHCHLDFEHFDADRDAVLERARSQGVVTFINPGTTLKASRQIAAFASENVGIYAAIGVHPTETDTWDHETCSGLRNLAQEKSVVAIGEIGLDYYWMKSEPHVQQEILGVQLEIAHDCDLPVILHNRESTEDLITVLHKWQSAIKSPLGAEKPLGVFHAFSGSLAEALRISDLGYMIGIGGPVTFRNAHSLVEVVRGLPIENIVLETDSPFLSPHPYRGKRNEPWRVRLIAEKIAEIKGLSFTEVCQKTTANACRLFRGRIRVNHG